MVVPLQIPGRREGTADLRRLPFRPAVRRFARAVVRELTPLVTPVPRRGRRFLALFIDGLAPELLASAGRMGLMRFLPALRDSAAMVETRGFSGMPSSTAPFQAGLFYGLRHPDVPGFIFHDRASWTPVRMYDPHDASRVEARLAGGRKGILAGGGGYLTILRGSSPDHTSTASMGPVLERREFLHRPRDLAAQALVQPMAALRVLARVARESGTFWGSMARQVLLTGSPRHEWNYFLNRAMVSTVFREIAISNMIVDMVRGAPLGLITLHDYDEAAHRRGPTGAGAVATLRSIDEAIEILLAVAAEVPDPPDPWIFTDHGQIAALPFEGLFGCTIEEWLLGAADGGRTPRVPEGVVRALGAVPGEVKGPPMVVSESGNFAHVYLEPGPALDGSEVLARHAHVLARALDCPGIGLVAIRSQGRALAFAGGRVVDPRDPATVPRGASPRAVAALLRDLPRSPSSGDIVLYGSFYPGGCVSFAWEFSSHGGVSPVETETFVIHPPSVRDLRIGHGADLHRVFRSLYGAAWTEPTPAQPEHH